LSVFVEILDTTLRDGAQGEGVSFSPHDKRAIIEVLDELGVRFIEAGNPASNPKDASFFKEAAKIHLKNGSLCAFGSTRKKESLAKDDANLNSLLKAETGTVVIFGKASLFHVANVLKTSPEENLDMIADSVSFLRREGRGVIYDAEHFFDGWKENAEYAVKTVIQAAEAGADRIVLCDTNGGAFASFVEKGVRAVLEALKMRNLGAKVGIHAHNDMGLALSVSIAAVEAGASHVHGTLSGAGERCGNTCLSSLIPSLELKMGVKCLPDGCLMKITPLTRKVAEISNLTLPSGLPYIGSGAFAHKAGMHADAILKTSSSFEHIDPALVGAERRFLISEMGGRSVIAERVRAFFPRLTKDAPIISALVERVKAMEAEGWQFEGADASFELLARKFIDGREDFFTIIAYNVTSAFRASNTAKNGLLLGAEATAWVKVLVKGEEEIAAAEGDGPVNALDGALRRALLRFFPQLSRVRLSDYKVRVINSSGATAAKVRVLIESTDGDGEWTTIGVSTDVIEASRQALASSIEYKLLSETVSKPKVLERRP
jgi:2-isopropylmalate synthase